MQYPKKKILYWSLLLAYSMVMLFLSTAKSSFIPPDYIKWQRIIEATGHFCLSGGLALFILFGLNLKNGSIKKWNKNSYWTAFLYSFFFGVITELIQTFVPMRETSLYDAGINALGIIIVLLVTYAYNSKDFHSSSKF